ncbi:zinc finger protein 678 [Aedes aegypti]|uniref:C2H2-type domain-containing protein n=1 Tax=Aedes aegypti TaxID=7159 RepID=A0A1S4FNR4_AEDAE|nr:zinc finger protein 678 [Aedes aegypti]
MLLRQFISGSNAIEEIYIVKRENESDNEENPPLEKMLPETGAVPVSMTSDDYGTDLAPAIEIKDEPEEDDGDNKELLVECGTEVVEEPEPKAAIKSENEDDIPLSVRLKKLKQSKAARKARKRKKLKLERSSSESDNGNAFAENEEGDSGSDEDEKRPRGEPNCNVCSTKFQSQAELKVHLRKKHSEMVPFRCEKCASGEVKSVSSLNRHFEMHDPDKPHKCNYCEARFSTRINRTAHQRRYHKADLENDTIRNANRRFVCRYCNKRFAAKFNLERHERNHEMKITDDEEFLNRRNKCYICDSKPCDSKEALTEHLSIHVDKLPYTCIQCEEPGMITSVRLLNKHLASHEEPEKPIKCVYCDERFISVVVCQAHERSHAQEKEADEKATAKIEAERISTKIIIVDGMKRYVCGYCGNSYSLLSTLRRHENIHTGKIQYVCKICGKIFNKSSCLLQHERTHSQDAPYKCEICNRGFKETIRLIEHRRIHSGERPFNCPNCFKSFRIKPLLKEHILLCTAPDICLECECRFCSNVFSTFRLLSEHILNNHPLTIEETNCEFCDLKFKDSLQLAEHEHYHRNPNSIKCDICGRIFKQLSNLRRHQRLHSNDAVPFQCDLCGKNFSQAGALKVHKRIHSGEKPYKCELCDKHFYHSSTMNRHKRSHYKSKSKLFLFGENNSSSQPEDDQQIESKPDVTIITISSIEDCITPKAVESNSMSSIPTSVEDHNLLEMPQVPNDVHTDQQQIELSNFNIAGTNTVSIVAADGVERVLDDDGSLYVLSTKMMIPQTIMQHHSEDQNAAECLNLDPSMGPM